MFSTMKLGIIVCSFLLLVLSCKNQQIIKEEIDHISVYKSSCEGFCPVYTLDIFSNGKANYKGELNVLVLGGHGYQFSEEDTKALFELVNNLDFNTLKDKYDSLIPDLPETVITYKSKRIVIKDARKIPIQLSTLLSKLNELALITKFIK